MNRRDFFKKVANKTLPIFVMSIMGDVLINKVSAKSTTCSENCVGGCSEGCYGTCAGYCKGGCKGSCKNSCEGSSAVCTY